MKTTAALRPISRPLLIGCVGILLGFSACHSPEQTAKIISKKARQKVGQLCTSAKINPKDCLPEMEDVFAAPSLSDQFSDKTEFISTW